MVWGALLGVAGSLIAGSNSSKAASQAANAQLTATRETNALQKQIYDQTRADLEPYRAAGSTATPELTNRIMGGGGSFGQAQGDYGQYLLDNPDVAAWAQSAVLDGQYQTPEEAAADHYRTYGQTEGRNLQMVGGREEYTRPQYTEAPIFGGVPLPELDASAYQESPGFRSMLDQNLDDLQSNYAAGGLLQSGAAIKGVQDRAYDMRNQDYQQWFNNQLSEYDRNYANALAQYQSAAAATAQNNALQQGAFESDRTYGTSVYDADRNYDTSRYDTQTQNLFGLAGIGQNAAAQVGSAGQNYASAVGQGNQANANALAAQYNQQAAASNYGLGSIIGVGQNALMGGFGGSGFTGFPGTSSGSGWNNGGTSFNWKF